MLNNIYMILKEDMVLYGKRNTSTIFVLSIEKKKSLKIPKG